MKDLIAEAVLEESKKARRRRHFRMTRRSNLNVNDKDVDVESRRHYQMLCSTLVHLQALRDIYQPGSATRHVLSQACTRLRSLLKKLEQQG